MPELRLLYTTLFSMMLFSSASALAEEVQWFSRSQDVSPLVTRIKFNALIAGGNESYKLGGVPIEFTQAGTATPVQEETYLGIDLNMVYFLSDHISTELSLGFLTTSSINRTISLSPNTEGSTSGKVRMFPATWMLQYHPAPYGDINPYLGAGLHYTFIKSGFSGIEYDDAFGPALQLGMDWWAEDSNYGFNFDIKKIWMTTDVDYTQLVNSGQRLTSEIDFNPWTVSAGISYRF